MKTNLISTQLALIRSHQEKLQSQKEDNETKLNNIISNEELEENNLLFINTIQQSEKTIQNQKRQENKHNFKKTLSEEEIQYFVLDKICLEKDVFLIQNKYGSKRSQTIPEKSISLEEEQMEGKVYQKNSNSKDVYSHIDFKLPFQKNFYDPFNFSNNQNLYNIFLEVFLKFIFFYLLFGWIFGFVLLISLKEVGPNYLKVLFLIATFQFIFGSTFFWTYVGYGAKEQTNPGFYGINALTLTECIYFNVFIAGFGILEFYFQKSKEEGRSAIDKLEVPSDQLFLETMDRSNLSENMENNFDESIYSFTVELQQETSSIISEMTDRKKYQTIPKKWNSGFILLQKDQTQKETVSKQIIVFLGFVGFLFLSVHIVLPIYYLFDQCQNDFDIWNLVIVVFANMFYAMSSLLNCIFQTLLKEGFLKAETFTSLLEIQSNNSYYQLKKDVSSINIYCFQSIKTWFNIRFLMLKVNQQFFRCANVLQTIEVMTFLTLSTILFMDYSGAGWSRNQISSNELLFGLLLTNILSRLILFIIPLFFNFSYVNSLLQYNKEQIYSIKGKLQYISHHYKLFRIDYKNQIAQLLKSYELEKNTDSFTCFEKLLLKENVEVKKKHQHQIEQIRAIFEIIRNTELYFTKQNGEKSYNELDESEKIKCEVDYLSKLIKTYNIIYKDMRVYEDRHLLKFLGLIPISYGKAQAVAVIAIPALFSLVIQSILSKNE